MDIVSAEGDHEGGYILPGPQLAHRALTADTGRIRLDAEVPPTLAPGRSTLIVSTQGLARRLCGRSWY